jgi:hypothetical protein
MISPRKTVVATTLFTQLLIVSKVSIILLFLRMTMPLIFLLPIQPKITITIATIIIIILREIKSDV